MNDIADKSKEELELEAAIKAILTSEGRKKVVIAGPGAGKTTLFKLLLKQKSGDPKDRIVLTFINNLKRDLEKDLGDLAQVSTLHGYCVKLLHRDVQLRGALSPSFEVTPGLASIIKEDWELIRKSDPPQFVAQMRELAEENELDFYIQRGNYYDSVDFDDAVYRVYNGYQETDQNPEIFELVLIDEFQDFNNMEAAIIRLLGRESTIIVAGDDDQALYGELRSSTWDNIRRLCIDGEYEVFMLPFCLRCPEVIVDSVNDIIEKAAEQKKLDGRIAKPYKYFPPVKGNDSAAYPHILDVETTVQRASVNYMGQYVAQAIAQIPDAEKEAANAGGYPYALVIAAKPYRDQIVAALEESGIEIASRTDSSVDMDRVYGLRLLRENPKSNLGWRIILQSEEAKFLRKIVEQTADASETIFSLLPSDYRDGILAEAENLAANENEEMATENPATAPVGVLVTSFEGAKGLSAQHVFICGLHDGELPKDTDNVSDIEICKFIVGLTRTRKQCTLVHTRNFAGKWKKPSVLIDWIGTSRKHKLAIDKTFWNQ